MGFSNTFKSFLDAIQAFVFASETAIWYRGVNYRHPLHSGLFRLNDSRGALSEYLELEGQMYNYYRNLGYSLVNGENGWDLLYSMQHHGVKTRLLDWSESLAVALYFACLGWNHREPAMLWLLDPSKLNMLSLDKPKIITPRENTYSYPDYFNSNVGSFAIYPVRNNKRIIAQQGCFTVQGNSLLPLEDEYENLRAINGILGLQIPVEIKGEVLSFVKMSGTNHFSIMPDLAGLSIHVNEMLIQPAWR